MGPLLHDAVTLRHFAAVGRMDVLQDCHGHRPEPRWTEGIRAEIISAEAAGEMHCSDILHEAWLGTPIAPSPSELAHVYRLQVSLNEGKEPPRGDRGEAECIYFAEKYAGQLATDDNNAYSFAYRRAALGIGRVIDSIYILRMAVANGILTAVDAHSIAEAIEEAGRSLRREHRIKRSPDYFKQ